MTKLLRWMILGLLPALISPVLSAADDEDELPVFRPGLVGRYTQGLAPPVIRVDDDLQFVWRDGEAPDERLAAGPCATEWHGRLHTLAPGEYRLHVFAQGGLEINLNGRSILTAESPKPRWHESTPVQLAYGHHPLTVRYRRTGGDGVLKLCWNGPQFGVEPVPERFLFHDPPQSPSTKFDDGRLLVRALRCAACHDLPGEAKPLPAPALTHLEGNLSSTWLIDWLTATGSQEKNLGDPTRRRMPHQALSRDDAEAIAAYLFDASKSSSKVDVPKAKEPPPPEPVADGDKKKKPKPRKDPSVRAGEQLASSVGCLACHRIDKLGGDGLFAGTDLTTIAAKRSPEFFVRWLDDASRVNADHRMPQFKLESLDRADLAVYLMTLGEASKDKNVFGSSRPGTGRGAGGEGITARGKELVAEHRCAACHKLPGDAAVAARAKPLTAASNWTASCLDKPEAGADQTGPRRPGYVLDEARRAAIVEYLSAVRPDPAKNLTDADGRFVLVERNCIGCHSRGLGVGLADRVPAITAAHAELAPVQAALLPPSLSGVGDKLPDAAIPAAVKTERPPLRPQLRVRMPKFDLSDAEIAALQRHLIDHDRVPDRPLPPEASSDDVAQRLAARRLVTADGFGCTSCHKIGDAVPSGTIALAAMGTDLTMLGERIRKPWFDRWVRNPARIIPRMEMPAVQLPVRGVLHDDVNEQLAAVWKVLNEPGFTPPLPNPVRIVRSRNVPGVKEPPHVLTDVFIVDGETYTSPIVIGLPNRHNILFDLEHNRLAAWWTGDTALERTKGKSWYWEPGGTMVLQSQIGNEEQKGDNSQKQGSDSEITFLGGVKDGNGQTLYIGHTPSSNTQDLATIEEVLRSVDGVDLRYRIRFVENRGRDYGLQIKQRFSTIPVTSNPLDHGGFRRTWHFLNPPLIDAIIPTVLETTEQVEVSTDGRVATLPNVSGRPRMNLQSEGKLQFNKGKLTVAFLPNQGQSLKFIVDYLVDLPLDTFPNELPALPNPPAVRMDVVPGFETTRLPLPGGEMPTGLAWTPGGTLVVSSLKGRVLAARDTNDDGLEDVMFALSDDLATPYGLQVAEQHHREVIDVITKTALVRLHDDDGDGFFEKQEIAADGWGHTDDYHDWAVGLPKTDDGGYYVALPCQQDDRDPAKARLRGQGLKLIPREPTDDDPRRFRVEPFCGGLRFPMGLAVDRRGRLFATDNQGNYNPFNELNHLQPDKRFGFINKLEREPGFNPPVESPAVDIPHPWTRSVNGICFLDTPKEMRTGTSALPGARASSPAEYRHFGPFEGHLIGCEFNGRVLVRMSLEVVDGVMQGAAYPFSRSPVDPSAPNFEGPNVVAVAPDGDVYVGSLLDSGWGGGQNTGSIARLVPQGDLPVGIAEVRALSDGFVVRFTGAVDAKAAAKRESYTIEKYRRESTPQYGGDDIDRSAVKVIQAEPSADGREVRLKLEPLKAGFVYEFHLANLAPAGASFFPAEAHYTLKRVPR